jgi:outer membrane protein
MKKNIYKIALSAVLFIGFTSALYAQATPSKVCHVASQEVVEAMPESIAAEKKLKDLQKTYTTKISEMDREVKAKFLAAQNEAPTRTKEENERVKAQIQEDQEKLEEYYANSQKSISQKRVDLLKPIYEKVRAAIQKVAREKGFEYVLDSTTGTGILLADGYDLTPDVLKELGVTKK